MGKQPIGINGHVNIRGFQRHFHIGKARVLNGVNRVQGRLGEGLCRGIPVLLQQRTLQRTAVDAHPKRNASLPHHANDFGQSPPWADVARVDPHAVNDFSRFHRQPMVKVDVGNQGNRDLGFDTRQRGSGGLIRHGHPNQFTADLLKLMDLFDRGPHVTRMRDSHGLNGDGGPVPDLDGPHLNGSGLFSSDPHRTRRAVTGRRVGRRRELIIV